MHAAFGTLARAQAACARFSARRTNRPTKPPGACPSALAARQEGLRGNRAVEGTVWDVIQATARWVDAPRRRGVHGTP